MPLFESSISIYSFSESRKSELISCFFNSSNDMPRRYLLSFLSLIAARSSICLVIFLLIVRLQIRIQRAKILGDLVAEVVLVTPVSVLVLVVFVRFLWILERI